MSKIHLRLRTAWTRLRDSQRAISQMILLLIHIQPWYFLILLLMQVLQGLVPLGSAWITKELFDFLAHSLQQQQSGSHSLSALFYLLAAQACILLLNQGLHPLNTYFQIQLHLKLTLALKTSMYQKIADFTGLAYFEDPTFHDLIQIATNNAQSGPQQLLRTLTTLLQGGVTLGSFLGVLFSFNPLLMVIIGLGVLPQLLAQLRFGRQRFRLIFSHSMKERLAGYCGQVLTSTNFAKEVRLFHLGDYFLHKFVQATRAIHQAQSLQHQRELRWQLLLAVLTNLLSAGMFIFVAFQTYFGRLSLGDMALYTSAVSSVHMTLGNMILALTNMHESVRFFQQYTQLLALSQPLPVKSSPQPIEQLHTGIEFRNVSFRYHKQGSWILRHVNLFIPAKRCLALVGLNGAGKTTLVKLLTRLYDPTEGEILWDGIDIREFDPKEFRQHLGAIFQDFVHYELSVQENIGLGNVSQIDNRLLVEKAASKAGIHERIQDLSQGYESVLSRMLAESHQGVDFSGGEWQKLALARVFMRDAHLLILDEPTAALDVEAEYALYQHFKGLMQGQTCLLITHRFSTIRMADYIAVLENGQIATLGTHEELLAHGGTYARLYTLQAESYV